MNETVELRNIAFKMDSATVDAARAVLKENGYSLTRGMSLFLKNVALTQSVDLLDDRELENQRLFLQLKNEVTQRVSDVQMGKYYTDKDLVERYGL